MKCLALALSLASLAGCVSMEKFKTQESEAAAQRQRADALDAQLTSYKLTAAAAIEAGQKTQLDLTGRLKAVGDQLASAQTSNHDLQKALNSSKDELTQKVSSLIKERDALTQKSADLSTKFSASSAQAAQLSAQVAQLTAQIAEVKKKAADADAARAAAETAKAAEVEKVKKNYDDLAAGLKSEIAAGEIKITQLQGKLTVNLVDRILFDSGKAEIKGDGRKVLDKVGSVLTTVQGKNIRIEGHTDNKPIVRDLLAKYASNWELSTARATSVARYLQDHAKVDPARLTASGYGEYHPVASNDAPESRALNRRIEIVLVPRD